MKLSNITFDESIEVKKDILDLYGKTIDDEGFIVEKENISQKVLTPKGEEIRIDEWAGITKGSEAFVKKDAFSLLELAKKLDD
ncbi:hypothetical protein COS64_01030 [archaeon CG06_land_8_20_14_3_00_37_11]|nr:MAG: hypothetical protein COS64_01030 [archaeon CG06_land_8_20_14_3_00_37_11]